MGMDRTRRKPAQAGEEDRPDGGKTMHLHALVMAPSPISRESLKRALTGSGLARFTFTEAGSPEEARFRFDPEKTDLAFLAFDSTTPLAVAFRLVGALRLEQKHPTLIIVVGSEKMLEKVDLLDIDHAMVRPVRPQTIAAQLGPLLETIRAGA